MTKLKALSKFEKIKDISSIEDNHLVSNFKYSPFLSADLDGDGDVDYDDLLILKNQYGQYGKNLDADINGDGFVNISDFLILSSQYGQVINNAPVAVNDSYTITSIGSLETILIHAENNDYDPDGDNFGIVSIDGATIDYGDGVEVDLELDVIQLSGGTFGTFLIDTDDLDLDCIDGEITITYTIADIHGLTDTATITIDLDQDPAALIVGTNANDQGGSEALYHINENGGADFGDMHGGDCHDILVGDYSNVAEVSATTEHTDFNYQFIIDSTGSMYDSLQEIVSMAEMLFTQFNDYVVNGYGNIAVQLIDFHNSEVDSISINFADDGENALNLITDYVNNINVGGLTNFEVPLMEAASWLESSAPIEGAYTTSFFISDGGMNLVLNEDGENVASSDIGELTGVSDGSNEAGILQALADEVIAVNVDTYASNPLSLVVIASSGEVINTLGEPLSSTLFENMEGITSVSNDTLYGHGGNDIIFGDWVNTDQLAQDQNITIAAGASWEVFELLEAGMGLDTTWSNDDTIAYIQNNHETLSMETVDFSIIGDGLFVAGGNDTLYGGAGDDTLYGQYGNDVLHGNVGNDMLFGGGGNDTLYGGVGDDTLFGGDGNDILRAEDGNDDLFGGEGSDRLYAGNGHDSLSGGEGSDRLYAGNGNDTIDGGDGDDKLYGGSGDDWLYGGSGDDYMQGDDGDDILNGGAGQDVFSGGDGSDIFVWQQDHIDGSIDAVFDFNADDGDVLDISDLLEFYNEDTDAISDFVIFTDSWLNSIMSVDIDGTGTEHGFVDVAIFTGGADLDAADLLESGNLIV